MGYEMQLIGTLTVAFREFMFLFKIICDKLRKDDFNYFLLYS
jgi:hypothetical protein